MSDDEFYSYVRGEVADAAGIEPDEVGEMKPSEIEGRIEEQRGEPLDFRMPEEGERGYSPLLEPPPSKQERKRRKEIVSAILDSEKSPRRLKWSYKFEDTYNFLGNAAEVGRKYLVDETLEFAGDIYRSFRN